MPSTWRHQALLRPELERAISRSSKQQSMPAALERYLLRLEASFGSVFQKMLESTRIDTFDQSIELFLIAAHSRVMLVLTFRQSRQLGGVSLSMVRGRT
jgi:hypothetical protein